MPYAAWRAIGRGDTLGVIRWMLEQFDAVEPRRTQIGPTMTPYRRSR